ncbi:MAG: pilus assembly PilX N-terminal domain-containing protein [Methylophilus sp.]|nr:pilus assembly PilX N-terminal domain-containing protein [Methylophilus sp.]
MSINKMKNLSGHHLFKQQGVVLFIALVALVVMSLAAVALIRSVDTNTLIGGNLSFKQAATTSADAGIEAAIAQLIGMRDAVGNNAKNVLNDATHTMNNTDLTARPGYHSSVDPDLILTEDDTWDEANNVSLVEDASGNTVRYIVQRMCRTPDVAIQNANCLFSTGAEDKNGQEVPLPQNVCFGPGCPVAGQTPRIRVTVRVEGPKNAISYVQAFVH